MFCVVYFFSKNHGDGGHSGRQILSGLKRVALQYYGHRHHGVAVACKTSMAWSNMQNFHWRYHTVESSRFNPRSRVPPFGRASCVVLSATSVSSSIMAASKHYCLLKLLNNRFRQLLKVKIQVHLAEVSAHNSIESTESLGAALHPLNGRICYPSPWEFNHTHPYGYVCVLVHHGWIMGTVVSGNSCVFTPIPMRGMELESLQNSHACTVHVCMIMHHVLEGFYLESSVLGRSVLHGMH